MAKRAVKKGATRTRYPAEVRAKAIQMLKAGNGGRVIADSLGISEKAVGYWKRKAIEAGQLQKTNSQEPAAVRATIPYGAATAETDFARELGQHNRNILLEVGQLRADNKTLKDMIAMLLRDRDAG